MLRLSLALLLGFAGSALAASCAAEVENVGSKLASDHFFTQWQIHHDAGEQTQATVFFLYTIHYRTEGGEILAHNYVFRQRIEGLAQQYTKDDISFNGPVDIISVDFSRVSCSK